ncbi:MAG: hypothetical protein SOR72_06590 [Hornefia sp.]|nr:hypothetical protein [Hornefia sp.]
MIVIVGDKLKLGGLADVIMNRLNEEVRYIEENISIYRQENEILNAGKEDCSYIIYDTEQYYNEADEIINVIKRIYRTNKAKPILYVPTVNPKNEIIKNAVAQQIKSFINSALMLGEQKDQLEKILVGFFEANEREDVIAVQKEIDEDNKTLNAFVGELYDAKQREEEKEYTIIENKKTGSEVAINTIKWIFEIVFGAISISLMTIAIITLTYTETRTVLFKLLQSIWNQITAMI